MNIKDNLFYKILSVILIILHLSTFGPIRDALAFTAQSASYRLSAGTLTENSGSSYNKLLLHFDSPIGSTAFTDSSLEHHPVAANGNVQIDTLQGKFGEASARFDGSGDYFSLADSNDWNFGTGDFTIDGWVKLATLPAKSDEAAVYSQYVDGWHLVFFQVGVDGNGDSFLQFFHYNEGTIFNVRGDTPFVVDTWYHIAAVRNGNTITIYKNGLAIASGSSASGIADLATGVTIGASYGGAGAFLNGWIDELRVSKGIARWTQNFTPPTEPHSNDSDIKNFNKRWQDAVGEPCIGRTESASYILNAGFIPIIQSNPPILIQVIPYQSWAINTSKENAFDLDDYFTSPENYPLTYTVRGNYKINITIDPVTHIVSFSSSPDWFGVEKIYFIAADSEGNTMQSNEAVLQVAAPAGNVTNKPIIIDTELSPQSLKEGDLVTLTVKARDLDNQDLTFTYSDFFTETAKRKEGDFWLSEATWQAPAKSIGHYTVKVTVTDTTALTDATNVVVNIGNFNHAPVLDTIAEITVKEGDLAVISPHATDADGDPITFYFDSPFDSQGKWLTTYDDAGTRNIKVTASDSIDTVSMYVKVIINNTNRAAQAKLTLSKYTVQPNEVFNISLSASDLDGDAMTFVLKKDGGEIASGNIASIYTTTTSFSNIGDHSIQVTVTDSGGLTTTESKGVDVADPNANRNSINPVMGDFDGNALSDLGLHNSDTGTWEICISKAGVFENAVDWLSGFGASRDWWPMGGDFNGDGKTDIGAYNNTNGELRIALSSGSSFTNSGTWLTFSSASYSWQPTTGNFNGDKYTDFLLYNKDTGEVRVALGTRSGFGGWDTWATNFGTDYVAMSGDFNGDSLTDLCLFKKSTGEFKVAFSNSKAFVDGSSWISGFATDKDALISDFNNDGLADIGYWDKSSGRWYYAISTGASFINKGVWLDNFGASSDESGTTGDFDGNGVTDAACFDKDSLGITRWKTYRSTNKPADLLTEIDNGIGGKTQIVYTYAASAENNLLPFPVYVASKISLINTYPADRAATYIQDFNFSGGYYDSTEREFRGFAKVRVTDPITNNYSETYFYQGKPDAPDPLEREGALKGQIKKIVAFDGYNREISQIENQYEVKKAGPEDRFLGFPALVEQTTQVWEENNTSLSTKDEYTYDNIGNLLEEKDAGDISKTGDEKSTAITYAQAYEYNQATATGFNRPLETALKDKDGKVVSKKNFGYDTKGNLNKEILWIFNPLTMNSELSTTDYTYDSFGNLTSATNALGSVVATDYETDFYTYPQKVTNSLGHTIQYTYEPKFGVVKTVTDVNGATSTTTYDSLGRPIRGVRDDGRGTQVTVITYDYPDFNTKTTTNAIGLSSTEYIDGLGRKYKTVSSGEDGVNSRNVSSEVFYNSRGLTEKESLPHYDVDEDPAQISYIRYEYDIRGRVKKTISDFPGTLKDAESSIKYINPLYTETTDPLGHRKGTLKDVYGNIIEVTEFTSDGEFKTKYEYDTQNNLIKTTDAQNNLTQIFYDSLGRKLKMIDPDMGTWTYEYDLVGNLVKQTDAKGQELTFEYDVLNRLSAKRYTLNANPVTIAYIYDEVSKTNCIGRLSKITDQSGSTEFFYDKLGRETESAKTVNGERYTVKRNYDILDRLVSLTYPDGAVVNYSYDINSGLLEKVEGLSPQGTVPYVKDITYNAKGQIKTIKYGNNTQTDYTYGQDLRLSRIFTQGVTTLQDLNYIFDDNGNLTTLTDNLRSNIRKYLYDDLDRLKEAQDVPAPGGGYDDYYYKYDSIGNLKEKTEPRSTTIFMTYGQNAGPHALTGAGGYTYQYDPNGNMISGKNKTMRYDVENRLIEVNELGTITSFTYDGDGGRVKKTSGSTSTIYIGSLYETTSQRDNESTITKHIFSGANRVCTVTKDEGRGTTDASYYHTDHLGSSSVITDANGNKVEQHEYTPYGAIATSIVNRASSLVNHKFTGKELDNTGLYFYGARYYDPEIGRFITADTIVQAPYDPQSLNRYSYCRNNPINYVDPTGHSWKSFWKKFGSTVLSVVGVVLAPFTGGLSLYLTYAATIYSGVQAAQAGQFGAWAAGFAISMALGFALPVGNFANPLMQVGVGALRGAAIGAVSGGVASVVGGGSFGAGALQGAIGGAQGGAISGFFTSQQYTNWGEGYGFKSNQGVIDNLAKQGRFQEAIDFAAKRYGYQSGTWDPDNPAFKQSPNTIAFTDPATGKITYGRLAFSERSMLQGAGFHESVHFNQVTADAVMWDHSGRSTLLGNIKNRFSLEVDASRSTLQNAGRLGLTNSVIQNEKAYLEFNTGMRSIYEVDYAG